MGDDIGSGSVCFDFCSTNVVQLSNWKYVVYGRLTTIDDSSSWTRTDVITHESPISVIVILLIIFGKLPELLKSSTITTFFCIFWKFYLQEKHNKRNFVKKVHETIWRTDFQNFYLNGK